MSIAISDIGIYQDMMTGQRVTAHQLTTVTPKPAGSSLTEHDFITVPEKHPYPLMPAPMFVGLWKRDDFISRFTWICNK
jgi:hypothetical protein